MQEQLIHSARIGNLAAVQEILAAGADVNADSPDGTALMAATLGGHWAVVKLLLEAGAEVNAGDTSGNSALMEASLAGHARIVQLLLGEGAEINAANSGRGHRAAQSRPMGTYRNRGLALQMWRGRRYS